MVNLLWSQMQWVRKLGGEEDKDDKEEESESNIVFQDGPIATKVAR